MIETRFTLPFLAVVPMVLAEVMCSCGKGDTEPTTASHDGRRATHALSGNNPEAADRLISRSEPPTTRTLRFPEDRSVGWVYVRDWSIEPQGFWDHERWDSLGQAKGKVIVPAGKQVQLEVVTTVVRREPPLWSRLLRQMGFRIRFEVEEVVYSPEFSLLDELAPDDLQVLKVSSGPTTDTNLRYLRRFAGLKEISFMGSGIGDDGLRAIAGMTGVRRLNLHHTLITDAGVVLLEKLPNLEVLILPQRIGDAGLAHLKEHPSLKGLELFYNERVTDAGLAHLAHMTGLEDLSLWQCCKIGDEGIAHLRYLKTLKYLELGGTRVTNAALENLRDWTSIQHLGLSETHVTDQGLSILVGLQTLQRLDLRETPVSDAGLVHLREIRSLRVVELWGTRVSAEGMHDLARSLPNLLSISK